MDSGQTIHIDALDFDVITQRPVTFRPKHIYALSSPELRNNFWQFFTTLETTS